MASVLKKLSSASFGSNASNSSSSSSSFYYAPSTNGAVAGSVRRGFSHSDSRSWADVDIEKVINSMEKGHRVSKVSQSSRRTSDCTQRQICIKRETRQLLLFKNEPTSDRTPKAAAKPSTIDIRTIKEVQILDYKLSVMRLVDKWKRELICYDPTKVLIIYYGSQFVLNTLIIVFDTPDACRLYSHGLKHLQKEALQAPYPLLVERYLRKEFYAMANPVTNCISVKNLKPFIQQRLQYKISSKELQELTEVSIASTANFSSMVAVINHLEETWFSAKERMGFEAFANAYRRLIYMHQLFSNNFAAFSDDGKKVDFVRLQRFLVLEQNDDLGRHLEVCSEFWRRYLRETDPSRDIAEPYLTVQEFMDFLFSRENSIWDPKNDVVVQDMDQPLCDYWIASSHNTYLTGDQLKSESSYDAYSRALLMGCRSIELDCWDGPKKGPQDAEIVIYHGYTMTTKLNLRDVLHVIKEYAFVTSDFPVVLSIEDNCTVQFQRVLANDLKEILGDYLLTVIVDKEANHLPSPNQLKRKIIVKHKKLPTENDLKSAASLTSLDDSFQDHDLLSRPGSLRKGVLDMKDPESIEWFPHIFVLFPDRLCYMADNTASLYAAGETGASGSAIPTAQDNTGNFAGAAGAISGCAASADDDVPQDHNESEHMNSASLDELHLTEEWFHGKITRDEAATLLLKHVDLGNGVFLVRESTTFIGDYSLSFYFNGEVHHCRIKTAQTGGTKHYFLYETKKMETLYELISYYQEHSLTTPRFRATLGTPCPQPCPHIGQPWFAGDIDRQTADDMLNKYPLDGAFLIRYSSSGDNAFTLSFRVDGFIKHCRLKQEGRMFVVGNHQFENLNWLVEYYSKHELYNGVCLKYTVNPETIELYSKDVSSAPGSSYIDVQKLEKHLLVRAKFGYQAKDEAELSFPSGVIITVLSKADGFWWRGVYKGKQGLIPAEHVEVLTGSGLYPMPNVPWQHGEGRESGSIDMAGCLVELVNDPTERRQFVFRVRQATRHPDEKDIKVSANSKEDLSDWYNSLVDCTRLATDKASQLRSKEKVLRIASELSNLVVYCQAVPFNPERIPGNYFEMCSFSDSKFDKLMEKGLVKFNHHQISRVYPNASRLTSANFNPMAMWNAGCQMVALNYQTPDKPMQLNEARFAANGRCGYVLKPVFMRHEKYDPEKVHTTTGMASPITLTIEIVAGRHLSRKDKGKGIVSPVVEMEILGLPFDCQSARTKAISGDGLRPVWKEQFEFNIQCPEAALLRFLVEDGDFIGPSADPFIGQATFPVDCIRGGYRSVPLRNTYSEELELSSLLVHVHIVKR